MDKIIASKKLEELYNLLDKSEKSFKIIGNALETLNMQIKELKQERDKLRKEKEDLIENCKAAAIEAQEISKEFNMEFSLKN